MIKSKEKILNAISFCRKAGKLAIGNDAVQEIINNGTVKLILFASDYSENSKNKIKERIANPDVVVITPELTMDEIWYGMGKRSGILGTQDVNFAAMINKAASIARQEEEIK